jgi:hypothetical protein
METHLGLSENGVYGIPPIKTMKKGERDENASEFGVSSFQTNPYHAPRLGKYV